MVRATVGHLRVARLDDAARIGEEGRARLVAVEEIKPLAGHRPEQRVARHRSAARDRHRVVAAEARHIDLRMLGKGRPIALVAEAPDRAVEAQFQVRAADFRLGLSVK